MATVKNRGLGAGLESMFSVKNVADILSPKEPENTKILLPISKLVPGKYQTRHTIPASSLKELADSIKENGIINPIVVRKLSDQKYEILAGERRFRAAEKAGLTTVPVTIIDADDKKALTIGLIENLQREDLNVLETAEGINRLITEFRFSHEEAARAVGRSRSAVSNLIRLLNLPDFVQELIRKDQLQMGHARALLSLDEDQQAEVANIIIEKDLSVRQTESLVNALKAPEPEEQTEKPQASLNKVFQSYQKELVKILGNGVRLTTNKNGKGKIEIPFSNQEDLKRIVERLQK